MTRIITGGLENDQFNFWQFYLARGKRIIPALIVLCSALMIFGWFMLSPVDYRMLATHAISSLLFFSNIKYWREAGYFDTTSHDKWLLHSWSLSVEWQFYLLLPLLLWVLWRWRPNIKTLLLALAFGLLASLLLSIFATPWRPTAAFYLIPTRAWEMLAGGLVFLLQRNHICRIPSASMARALEIVGLTMIITAITVFSLQTPWPSAGAMLPVAGAVLVLIAARNDSLWTGGRLAQWLGNNSYSVYLWHWPCVVALNYLEKQNDPLAIGIAMVCSLLLGEFSYRFVENPTRHASSKWQPRFVFFVLAISVIAVLAPASWVRLENGVYGRLTKEAEVLAEGAVDKNPRMKECFESSTFPIECTYGGEKLGAIVIGDSHAASIMRTAESSLPDKNKHILDWSLSSCPTIQGAKRSPESPSSCLDFLSYAFSKNRELPKNTPLIIMNRTSVYLLGQHNNNEAKYLPIYFNDDPIPIEKATPSFFTEFKTHLINTTCELAKERPVYLVRPIPEMMEDVPKIAARRFLMTRHIPEISISLEQYHERHNFVWAAQDAAQEQCGVKILDPLPYLCWDGRCHAIKDGRSMYYDDDHLSEYGAHLLQPMFAKVFEEENRTH